MAEKDKNQGKWLPAYIGMLKELKKPTDAQKLLLTLHKKPDRTATEQKYYLMLVNAEKAEDRARTLRTKTTKIIDGDKEQARKDRANRLIELGLLFDFVGMESWSREELLGALIEIKSDRYKNYRPGFKEAGRELLARINASNDNRRSAKKLQSTELPVEPDPDDPLAHF